MFNTNLVIIVGLIAVGVAIGYLARKFIASRQIDSAEVKAQKLLTEAKTKQKELLIEAKSQSLKIIDQAKHEEERRRKEVYQLQQRLERRETLFGQKLIDLQAHQQRLYEKVGQVEAVKAQIEEIKNQEIAKLEKIASLSQEEAKRVLIENTEQDLKEDLLIRIKKIELKTQEELEEKAKEVLSLAIERCASSHAAETTSTTVDLPNEEMKGRIIGREGRNIKLIEQLSGVEIVVDDTPGIIMISGFSPIRRQIAKLALEKLILDGRIHPAKIEETIEISKKELAKEIKKAGEDALYQVGITNIDPKLVQILGRLKYRTSYGQNVWQHSIEVAFLSALLAEELKADVTIAKKAGLLHDIGKAVDHEVQGTHAEIGRDIGKKFNLSEEVLTAIATHHDDCPPTLEAIIVKVADAISGARLGARKDTYERYLQRLEELEKLASSFAGVEKTYAIQAGREIRVFVTPQTIDDLAAFKLAKDIAQKIEQELKYPGEIKVNVIRETRVTEYAR